MGVKNKGSRNTELAKENKEHINLNLQNYVSTHSPNKIARARQESSLMLWLKCYHHAYYTKIVCTVLYLILLSLLIHSDFLNIKILIYLNLSLFSINFGYFLYFFLVLSVNENNKISFSTRMWVGHIPYQEVPLHYHYYNWLISGLFMSESIVFSVEM